ncbi:MAG: ceramidase domain-containing protein [Candidatus Thiodiazotropha taylori]
MSHSRVAVTHYCERASDLFWAEPINATTNLIFLIAAFILIRNLQKLDEPFPKVWDMWLLSILIAGIGVGSFLWHTFATPWAELADVIPIALFVTLFLISFLLRILRLDIVWIVIWTVLFLGFTFYLLNSLPSDLLNGSVFYLPAWIGVWVLVIYSKLIDLKYGNRLIFAAIAFTLSLSFRTVDRMICEFWPWGTHFLWHLINGLAIYFVMSVLIAGRICELAPKEREKMNKAKSE